MRYAPGNHTGPDREDKGLKGGACNVTACQLPGSAHWFNHSTQRYYCETCATAINDANRPDSFVQGLGHDLCTLETDGPRVTAMGKQLLLDDKHLADCRDPEAAEVIAVCLNAGSLDKRLPQEARHRVEEFFA